MPDTTEKRQSSDRSASFLQGVEGVVEGSLAFRRSLGEGGMTAQQLSNALATATEARGALDGVISSLEQTIPKGLYATNLATLALQAERAAERHKQPSVLDTDDVFNLVTGYVADHTGEFLDLDQLLEYLEQNEIVFSYGPKLTKELETLIIGWQDELADYLNADYGVEGLWALVDGKLVFAQTDRQERIQKIVNGAMQPLPPKTDSDISLQQIYGDDDTEYEADTADIESDTKPAELTDHEAAVLSYLSRISVSRADSYPPTKHMIDEIVTQTGRDEAYIEKLVQSLLDKEYVFPYKNRGKKFVTTNANIAHSYSQKTRERKERDDGANEVRGLDTQKATDVIEILLMKHHAQKFTLQQLWSMMQLRQGIDTAHHTIPSDEAERLKITAVGLKKLGILFASNYKAQTSGARGSARRQTYKVGFVSESAWRSVESLDHKQLLSYIESLRTAYIKTP